MIQIKNKKKDLIDSNFKAKNFKKNKKDEYKKLIFK